MCAAAQKQLRFSVIVASRHRPEWLKLCLSGLRQQDYPSFEILVVADPSSISEIADPHIKTVDFDTANLSAARNIGIEHAGGDVCAFIDDDAVPEPMWLYHLDEAFRKTGSDAVTGYVRGRNGISLQSTGHTVDPEAETHQLIHRPDTCFVPQLPESQALKLIGTNMAIRRASLSDVDGFDESFRFFLEDADVSLRLAAAGKRLALQPMAQVHHGFAESPRRTANRTPLDLTEIGRSTAIFLRKHLGHVTDEYWLRLEKRETARLVRHMVGGACEPRDVTRRLQRLRAGWEAGLDERIGSEGKRFQKAIFDAYPIQSGPHKVMASFSLFSRPRLRSEASNIVANGARASVFSFSLTPFRHRVRYVMPGYWLQTGGLFGRSDRRNGKVGWCRFADRLQGEIGRVAKARGIGESVAGSRWDASR